MTSGTKCIFDGMPITVSVKLRVEWGGDCVLAHFQLQTCLIKRSLIPVHIDTPQFVCCREI
jgi:hypothetical protein